jgi:HSP20 family molecular chaperone IbpA
MATEMTSSMDQAPARQERNAQSERGATVYRPLADIVETKEGVAVRMEMPGVGADDIEISLERRVLTVRGRGRVTRPEGYRLIYAEYGEGDYERTFVLSQDIDEARIAAEMKDGVLNLVLPRSEAAKPKRIQVRSA